MKPESSQTVIPKRSGKKEGRDQLLSFCLYLFISFLSLRLSGFSPSYPLKLLERRKMNQRKILQHTRELTTLWLYQRHFVFVEKFFTIVESEAKVPVRASSESERKLNLLPWCCIQQSNHQVISYKAERLRETQPECVWRSKAGHRSRCPSVANQKLALPGDWQATLRVWSDATMSRATWSVHFHNCFVTGQQCGYGLERFEQQSYHTILRD